MVVSDDYIDIESDDESDVDVDGGELLMIECFEDFVKYERWKVKRDVKDVEFRVEFDCVWWCVEEERLRIEEEMCCKYLFLKDMVIEWILGEGGVLFLWDDVNVDVIRKLSWY